MEDLAQAVGVAGQGLGDGLEELVDLALVEGGDDRAELIEQVAEVGHRVGVAARFLADLVTRFEHRRAPPGTR